MTLGVTATRVLVGGLFVGHGLQKLAGKFGGHGLEGTAQFFESLGLRPGRRHAMLAGAAEAGGGALLAAGFLTPLGAAAITGVMTQAIRSIHAKNGPWVSEGGWEYNAVLIAVMFAVADAGPGPLSLDRALGTELSGPFWATLAVAAGAGGAILATRDAGGPAPEQAPVAAEGAAA